ncbi:MAG TPA: SDR family oxidoreductase [Terriglobales bacterium]|jgi:3-oxoacyl-[acyl-carrier protein] reductase|nr:SDR family oxidoreductase [Terriglobales bacterium]
MQTGLKDRIAIVCGASSGMGRATAAAFAAEGAKVAMCARTEKTLFAAADEIKGDYKTAVFAQAVDVTDSDAVKKFVAAVAERFGGVDICVANAGGPPTKNFLSITTEEWNKAVATNFLSVVHLAREVIPHMQRKRWGRLITITSTSVRQPVPDLVLSNSVRPAVVGLVKSLAGEFGKDGILVNNVAPGYTETERLSELSKVRALAAGVSEEEIKNRWTVDIPLRRLGKPEEIADAIVWLASERASYITGQTILVDGGIYKGM